MVKHLYEVTLATNLPQLKGILRIVLHNIDFSKEPFNTNVSQYPLFPVSQVVPLFSVSESTHDVLEFSAALTLTNVEAVSLEIETTGQLKNKPENGGLKVCAYPQKKAPC